jgi:hypothetical protein
VQAVPATFDAHALLEKTLSRGLDDDRSERADGDRERSADPRDDQEGGFLQPIQSLRGSQRDLLSYRDREYRLSESDARTLATIGAFRVVSVDDFDGDAGRSLRQLESQGLVRTESLVDRYGVERTASLTHDAKSLIDAHTSPDRHGHRQEYFAGVVKPRELRHDVQLYRAFKEEARRIRGEGGRVTGVVLDYELKRDYQRFLNRPDDKRDNAALDRDRREFAKAYDLPLIRGHVALPDLRIEYETEDGRLDHRDVEVITEHYSRSQIGGKSKAGFACYRAAGDRKGGTPFDPRHLERL